MGILTKLGRAAVRGTRRTVAKSVIGKVGRTIGMRRALKGATSTTLGGALGRAEIANIYEGYGVPRRLTSAVQRRIRRNRKRILNSDGILWQNIKRRGFAAQVAARGTKGLGERLTALALNATRTK